jgi:hypothetical protein
MSYESVPGLAPVFPLPNCVLFPKVLLPLRIFEPRYKAMMQRVVDSAGWLAMGLLQGDRERDSAGHPDVFPIAGLGRVVDYQKASDGSYKLVLLGEHRVRLKDWAQVEPFPICTLEKFTEVEPGLPFRADLRDRLRERIKRLVPRSVDSQVLMLLDQTITESEEIGPVLDSIAYHFLSSPKEKQRLLEVSDAVARERLLVEILERQRFGPGSRPQSV